MAEEEKGIMARVGERLEGIAENNRKGLGAFLDKFVAREKKSAAKNPVDTAKTVTVTVAKPVTKPVGEVDEKLYGEIQRYGQEHPELQDQYPSFDDLAEYYMKEVRPNMKMTKTVEFLDRLKK